MVEVMREVWRVLRDDGTVWLNLGDSYAANRAGGQPAPTNTGNRAGYLASNTQGVITVPRGLKPKDLIGIPWRTALALQADGWYLRSAIVWAKGLSFCPTYSGSVMPESVRDRPTSAYEMVFLLSKQKTYFYDGDAVREAQSTNTHSRGHGPGGPKAVMDTFESRNNSSWAATTKQIEVPGGRNLRNVWTINPTGFPGAHFATFPPALVEPCIKAGTSERGVCAECGAPWERVTDINYTPSTKKRGTQKNTEQGFLQAGAANKQGGWGDYPSLDKHTTTLGWAPTCDCPPHEPVPATVLDPFFGAGTTGIVARSLGRDCIGIELSEAYVEMARRRLDGVTELEVTNGEGEVMAMEQGTMFSTVTVS
jgi:DNA modification methylase